MIMYRNVQEYKNYRTLSTLNNYITFPIRTDFIRSKKGKHCRKNNENVLEEFTRPSGGGDDAIMSRNECEEYCLTQETCWGCSVYCGTPCQWNAITDCGDYDNWAGLIDGDVTHKEGENRFMW